ncbi:hypothetical protein [Flavivirga jejuensis]|uniref:Uncharacterized protein n=1 Tax=Flavivirga jejuensis TaxID=870487 RepID=A0ABT8WHR8_9FLAO|nr:hypothetical protein [Flavivirga jejuensis]MDO5972696.1 hypothetical protein [Flavivirga jejuensis]
MKWIDTIIYKTLITHNSVKVNFINGELKIGFFEPDENFDSLKSEGKLRFVENLKGVTIIKANDISEIK